MTGWSAPDDDFILLWNILGKLKTLILEECANLTDFGFLGAVESFVPAIMNLKGNASAKRHEMSGWLTKFLRN